MAVEEGDSPIVRKKLTAIFGDDLEGFVLELASLYGYLLSTKQLDN
ncbi:hypothetical protein N9N06_04180 [Aquiluna sp.]|nr:hypothetical protein [Aquiluna sp.]